MSATPCAVLLEEARAALHKMLTGAKVVQVSYNGRTVQYRNFAEDEQRLRNYIRELEAQCGDAKPRRPFEVTW